MDLELMMIFGFIIAITAIVGGAVNGIVSKVLEYKKSENMRDNGQSSAPVSDLAERTELIEDRLRVLERLATDRGQLLADEIEALRENTSQSRALRDNRDKERA